MKLPTPPTDKEKFLYVDQNKWLVYGWGLFSYMALITGMLLFSFMSSLTYAFLPITVLTIIYLGISYFIGIFGKEFNLNKHQIRKNYWLDRYGGGYKNGITMAKPSIDIYLPSCGESLDILANTFKHARALNWQEGRIHFYVLDDSARRDVEILADKFEFNYISRPAPRLLKKAGNIRFAFQRTSGDFILILDADFAPRTDMLLEMISYMSDERTAIVQTPQFFEIENDQTWIMKGAAYIQELFYRMIQVHRDTWSASICVGTCALYRRTALIPHGGTYAIEYSEDMHTGWQLTVDGWIVKYVPLNLAKGLCPESMSSFFVQQTRWCTGSVGLLLSKKFWTSPLGLMPRLCYVSGMLYYIATALTIVVGGLPSLIIVWIYPEHLFWYNYLWSIPSFLMSIVILNIWSRAPWGIYVMSTRQVSYYAHCFALWNKMKGTLLEWIPSGNNYQTKKVEDYARFKTAIFLWTSIITFGAISGAFWKMQSLGDYNFYPILFFTSINYFVCIRCLKEEA